MKGVVDRDDSDPLSIDEKVAGVGVVGSDDVGSENAAGSLPAGRSQSNVINFHTTWSGRRRFLVAMIIERFARDRPLRLSPASDQRIGSGQKQRNLQPPVVFGVGHSTCRG